MRHLNMSAAFISTLATLLDPDWYVKPAEEARYSLLLRSLATNRHSTSHRQPLTLALSAKPLQRRMQMNGAQQWTPRSATYTT